MARFVSRGAGRPALALFDIDGTLLRGAGPHHRQALENGIRAELKLDATMSGIDTPGTLDRDLIRLMLGQSQAEADDNVVDRIALRCQQLYLENCANNLRHCVLPGVTGLLERLQEAEVVVGVVTGNLEQIGWKKLELAGLRNYFALGAFSQDGSTRAALAAKAAERARELTGTEFRDIALIGDHRNDVIAAKTNGFRSIAVATGALTVEQLQADGADLAVSDMTELSPDRLFY